MVHVPSLTTNPLRLAETPVVLRCRFRRPVRYRMTLALPGGQAPRTEVCGTVDAFDRARRPPMHPGHANVRGEAVQYRRVRRPAVGWRARLGARVDPFL